MHTVLLVAAATVAAPTLTSVERITLGEGLVGRGDAKKAQGHLEKALLDPALSPKDAARAEQALGLALLQQQKGKDAVPHLEKAAAQTPASEKVWLYLGIAKDQAGDTAGSLDAYARGVAAVPKSTSLKHEYGMALLSAGKNTEGATVLEDAATKNEADPELAADAAYALSLVGKFKQAREFALRAVEMSPDDPNALYTLGMAELGLGNSKRAAQVFVDAIDADETHLPALFQLGLVLQAAGDHRGAVKQLTQALKIEPQHARARAALGISLTRLGTDDAKAEQLLVGATNADPKNAAAWFALGDLQARQGKITEAKKALQTSQKLQPTTSTRARLDSLTGAKEGTGVPSLP